MFFLVCFVLWMQVKTTSKCMKVVDLNNKYSKFVMLSQVRIETATTLKLNILCKYNKLITR